MPGAGESRESQDPVEAPEAVDGDQWQQLLAVERHMRHLARQHNKVRSLRAPVHAWWARQSPESNAGAEALLETFLGQPLASSTWLDTDHLGIVRLPGFIDGMAERLPKPVTPARKHIDTVAMEPAAEIQGEGR